MLNLQPTDTGIMMQAACDAFRDKVKDSILAELKVIIQPELERLALEAANAIQYRLDTYYNQKDCHMEVKQSIDIRHSEA